MRCWNHCPAAVAMVVLLASSPVAAEVAPAVAPTGSTSVEALAAKYFPVADTAAPSKRIFRLTRDQLDATVKSLLPKFYKRSVTAAMPKDPLQTNFEFADLLRFTNANIGALTGWIGEIARGVGQDPKAVIDCPATDAICLHLQAHAFVARAFRGDVAEDKIERLAAFYIARVKTAGHAMATSELVEAVLNSPDFLFRKELDVDQRGRLADAQLLQALTYTLADVPPEGLGLGSRAATTYLRTDENLRATVHAILESTDARAKLMRFFTAWLEIKDPGEFTISTATYPEFDAKLSARMVTDMNAFLAQQLAKPQPSLKDITQARFDGGDGSQRLGVFSQPALIASHSGPTNTRLVKRGVFWVRKVMCMDMAPPPKGIDTAQYEAATTTERDRIEQITARKACIGCHKVIDPFGFFQENYDALGRWRTTDNGHPIDAAIDIDFLDEGPQRATTPLEALTILTNSARFKQCFVRQMFRYYMGRQETGADDPVLRRMFVDLMRDERQDILPALVTLATSDRASRRK